MAFKLLIFQRLNRHDKLTNQTLYFTQNVGYNQQHMGHEAHQSQEKKMLENRPEDVLGTLVKLVRC